MTADNTRCVVADEAYKNIYCDENTICEDKADLSRVNDIFLSSVKALPDRKIFSLETISNSWLQFPPIQEDLIDGVLVHWADMLTIDLLARLASAVYDLPALLVMTTRIEGEPLDPKWRGALQGAPLMTLDLQPLHSADAAMLARRLGVQESNALQQLVARAGGIPLFLEQLAVGGLATETLPTTIQSLVVARFDALPHAAQRTLMAASVIGQQFSLELISAVLKSEPELETLSQHGLPLLTIVYGCRCWFFPNQQKNVQTFRVLI